MGICSARNIPYLALRTSIVGALIPTEADFAEFFKSCRIETHGLKTTLTIHQLQSFFVVVSGEIAVCLTPKEEAGTAQVIGMDRGSVDRYLDERPHLKDLKRLLELQLSELKDFPAFASISPHQLNFLGPLMKLRLSHAGEVLNFVEDQATNNNFDLTAAVSQPSHSTKAANNNNNNKQPSPASVSYHPSGPQGARKSNQGLKKTLRSPTSSRNLHGHLQSAKLANLPKIATKPIGIVLAGSFMVTSPRNDIAQLVQEYYLQLQRTQTPQSSNPNTSVTGSGGSRGSLQRKKSNRRLDGVSHLFEKGSIELGGTEDKAVFARIIELLGRQLQTNIAQIYPGSVFGMDDYFIKHSAQMQQLDSNGAGIRKPVVVSAGRGLVGYLERDTLRYLFHFDRRMKRVMQRNYMSSMLLGVRPFVPMLSWLPKQCTLIVLIIDSDMDAKALHLLSSLITLKTLSPGEFVYRKGQAAEHCYVVVLGRVTELTEEEEGWLREDDSLSAMGVPNALRHRVRDATTYFHNHPNPTSNISTTQHSGGSNNSSNKLQHSPQKGDKAVFVPSSSSSVASATSASAAVVPYTTDGNGNYRQPSQPNHAADSPNSDSHTYYGPGSMLGEVALITQSPYFTSIMVTDTATTVITINKRSFERIYYGDSSKLAELNIRIMGEKVDVSHVLQHPVGNAGLLDHLKKEAADENILFLNAVARYEELCSRFQKDVYAVLVSRNHGLLTSMASAAVSKIKPVEIEPSVLSSVLVDPAVAATSASSALVQPQGPKKIVLGSALNSTLPINATPSWSSNAAPSASNNLAANNTISNLKVIIEQDDDNLVGATSQSSRATVHADTSADEHDSHPTNTSGPNKDANTQVKDGNHLSSQFASIASSASQQQDSHVPPTHHDNMNTDNHHAAVRSAVTSPLDTISLETSIVSSTDSNPLLISNEQMNSSPVLLNGAGSVAQQKPPHHIPKLHTSTSSSSANLLMHKQPSLAALTTVVGITRQLSVQNAQRQHEHAILRAAAEEAAAEEEAEAAWEAAEEDDVADLKVVDCGNSSRQGGAGGEDDGDEDDASASLMSFPVDRILPERIPSFIAHSGPGIGSRAASVHNLNGSSRTGSTIGRRSTANILAAISGLAGSTQQLASAIVNGNGGPGTSTPVTTNTGISTVVVAGSQAPRPVHNDETVHTTVHNVSYHNFNQHPQAHAANGSNRVPPPHRHHSSHPNVIVAINAGDEAGIDSPDMAIRPRAYSPPSHSSSVHGGRGGSEIGTAVVEVRDEADTKSNQKKIDEKFSAKGLSLEDFGMEQSDRGPFDNSHQSSHSTHQSDGVEPKPRLKGKLERLETQKTESIQTTMSSFEKQPSMTISVLLPADLGVSSLDNEPKEHSDYALNADSFDTEHHDGFSQVASHANTMQKHNGKRRARLTTSSTTADMAGNIYGKLLANLQEIRDAAGHIFTSYVVETSLQQVNLPHRMMRRIEEICKDWSAQPEDLVLQAMIAKIQRDITIKSNDAANHQGDQATSPTNATRAMTAGNVSLSSASLDLLHMHPHGSSTLHPSLALLSSADLSTNCDAVMLYMQLYHAAKLEIIQLIRSGPFVRWRATPAFAEFIQSLRPYDHKTFTPSAAGAKGAQQKHPRNVAAKPVSVRLGTGSNHHSNSSNQSETSLRQQSISVTTNATHIRAQMEQADQHHRLQQQLTAYDESSVMENSSKDNTNTDRRMSRQSSSTSINFFVMASRKYQQPSFKNQTSGNPARENSGINLFDQADNSALNNSGNSTGNNNYLGGHVSPHSRNNSTSTIRGGDKSPVLSARIALKPTGAQSLSSADAGESKAAESPTSLLPMASSLLDRLRLSTGAVTRSAKQSTVGVSG